MRARLHRHYRLLPGLLLALLLGCQGDLLSPIPGGLVMQARVPETMWPDLGQGLAPAGEEPATDPAGALAGGDESGMGSEDPEGAQLDPEAGGEDGTGSGDEVADGGAESDGGDAVAVVDEGQEAGSDTSAGGEPPWGRSRSLEERLGLESEGDGSDTPGGDMGGREILTAGGADGAGEEAVSTDGEGDAGAAGAGDEESDAVALVDGREGDDPVVLIDPERVAELRLAPGSGIEADPTLLGEPQDAEAEDVVGGGGAGSSGAAVVRTVQEPLDEAQALRAAALEEMRLVATLPQLSPPRAIVHLPDDREVVVEVGDMIGDAGGRIVGISEEGVTVAQVGFDEAGAARLVERLMVVR